MAHSKERTVRGHPTLRRNFDTYESFLDQVENDLRQSVAWTVDKGIIYLTEAQSSLVKEYNRVNGLCGSGYDQLHRHASVTVRMFQSGGYLSCGRTLMNGFIPVAIGCYLNYGFVPQLRQLRENSFQAPEIDQKGMRVRRIVLSYMTTFKTNDLWDVFGYKVGEGSDSSFPSVLLKNFLAASGTQGQSLFRHETHMEIVYGQSTAKPILERMKESITDAVAQMGSDSIFKTIKLSVSRIFAFIKDNIGSILFAIVIGIAMIILGYSIFSSELFQYFRSWILKGVEEDTKGLVSEVDTPEMKGQAKEHPGVAEVVTMVSKMFSAPPKMANAWVGEYARLGTNLKNIESLFEFTVTKVTGVIDFVSEKVNGVPYFDTTKRIASYKSIFESACSTLERIRGEDLKTHNSSLVIGAWKELQDISLECRKIGTPPAKKVCELVDSRAREFRGLMEAAFKISFSPAPRQTPVWLSIVGRPGVGKSFAMEKIKKYIFERILNTVYEPKDVFPLNIDDQYFSGWHDQDVTTIEECLTDTDSEKRNRLAGLLLKLINTEAHPLNAADLESKGKNYFKSKFIVSTANADIYPINLGLSDTSALWRRRSIVARVLDRVPGVDGGEDDLVIEFFPSVPDSNASPPVPYMTGGMADLLGMLSAAYTYQTMEFQKLKAAKLPEIVPNYKFNGRKMVPVKQSLSLEKAIPTPTTTAGTTSAVSMKGQGLMEYVTRFWGRNFRHRQSQIASAWASYLLKSSRENLKVFIDSLPTGFISLEDLQPGGLLPFVMDCVNESKKMGLPMSPTKDWNTVMWVELLKHANQPDETPTRMDWRTIKRLIMADRIHQRSFLAKVPIFWRFWWLPYNDNRLLTLAEQKVANMLPLDVKAWTPDQTSQFGHKTKAILHKDGHAEYDIHLLPETTRRRLAGTIYDPTVFDYLADSWVAAVFNGETPELRDLMKSPVFWTTAVLVLGALAGSMTYMWKWAASFGYTTRTTLEGQSEDKHLMNLHRKVLRTHKKPPRRVMRDYGDTNKGAAQMKGQSRVSDGTIHKIGLNVDIVEIKTRDTECVNYCLFLTGTIAALPLHPFKQRNRPVQSITVRWANGSQPVTIDTRGDFFAENSAEFPERDLCLVRLNTGQLYKNISGPAYLSDKVDPPGTLNVSRIWFDEAGNLVSMWAGAGTEWAGKCDVTTSLELLENPKALRLMDYKGVIRVPLPGKAGMCGLPYISNDGMRAIAGIHVAGDSVSSVIAPIFSSDLEKVPGFDRPHAQCSFGEPVLPDPVLMKEFMPSATPLVITEVAGPSPAGTKKVGEVNVQLVMPNKTKLRESVVSLDPDCPFEKLTGPAKLKPFVDEDGVRIVPLDVAMKKFENKALPAMDPLFDDQENYDGVFHPKFPYERVRELTQHEAINGVPEWGMPGLDLHTGTGIGFSHTQARRLDLFAGTPGNYAPKPVLQDMIDRKIATIRKGDLDPLLAQGLLKDEKRPNERVRKGMSRLFYAGDIATLIVHRMFLGGLISAMTIDPVYSDIAIGINPFGQQWRMLHKRLSKHPNITTADISGYDLNYVIGFMSKLIKALKFRAPKIPDSLLNAMQLCLQSSVQPLVFIGIAIFLMLIMCSGCFVTASLNSALNSVVHRGIFKYCVSKTDFTNVKFRDVVEASFYGDDSYLTVADIVKHLFNGVTIASWRKRICNWTSTSATKSIEIKPFDDPSEAQYLKRQFVERDGTVFPPLDKKAIEGMCLWFRKGDMPDAAQQCQNFEGALRESFYHGEEYFNEMRDILNPHFVKLRGSPFSETFASLMEVYLSEF